MRWVLVSDSIDMLVGRGGRKFLAIYFAFFGD